MRGVSNPVNHHHSLSVFPPLFRLYTSALGAPGGPLFLFRPLLRLPFLSPSLAPIWIYTDTQRSISQDLHSDPESQSNCYQIQI
ncbi:hypothetical protein LENED_009061 [Lentinula edodes]|uniref:Uncharacterized protein n=1 Tax=Lentinula edodes TaxID=5353 RepID=A0A1Q3EIY1_LENED|nr:hypothetical protein LENED_009061 [Lentinula edodes]